MQATDKANRETQRSAAYESLHYACLQAIEILKPTIIKEKRREIVNIDLSNIEAFAKYSFKEAEAEQLRYLPVLYIKPKKIRKPRQKRTKNLYNRPKNQPKRMKISHHHGTEREKIDC